MTCPACGIDRPRPAADVKIIDGSLVEYGSFEKGAEWTQDDKREVYAQLLWYAREHGYSDGWAYQKFIDKFGGDKPPWSWKSLEPVPPPPGLLRWIKSRNIRWAKSR